VKHVRHKVLPALARPECLGRGPEFVFSQSERRSPKYCAVRENGYSKMLETKALVKKHFDESFGWCISDHGPNCASRK